MRDKRVGGGDGRDNGDARNFIGQRFANAKSKDTADDAFHIAGEKQKKKIFNKIKEERGKTQCIHFAELKRNRDRKARARTYESERMCVYMLCVYVAYMRACIVCE